MPADTSFFAGWPAWLPTLLAIAGMAVVTLVTRGFFLFTERAPRIPPALHRALQVAPLAAMVALAVPGIVMTDGHLVDTWRDARLYAAAATTITYVIRPGMLAPLVVGMAVYLPLHTLLGW